MEYRLYFLPDLACRKCGHHPVEIGERELSQLELQIVRSCEEHQSLPFSVVDPARNECGDQILMHDQGSSLVLSQIFLSQCRS